LNGGAEGDETGLGRGRGEGIRELSVGCTGLVSATEVAGESCSNEELPSPLRKSWYALSKSSFAKVRARLFLRFRAFFLPPRKRLGGGTRGSTKTHRALICVSVIIVGLIEIIEEDLLLGGSVEVNSVDSCDCLGVRCVLLPCFLANFVTIR